MRATDYLSIYADDCYLVVPASGISTTESELAHIAQWSKSCNLRLNTSKSCEIIITRPHSRTDVTIPPIAGIERVTELKILGVTLSDRIGFSLHINNRYAAELSSPFLHCVFWWLMGLLVIVYMT